MDLNGKRVLVTGGALRVGAALSRAFAGAGAQVFIHCRNSREQAGTLASELPGSGHAVVCADFSAGAGGADELWEKLPAPVDILVNNASCYRLPETLAHLYEQVNHLAPVRLMERFAAQKIAEGAAVNLVDQAVLNLHHTEDERYVESRRKLVRATRDFAFRYAKRNLRFNAVAPGPVLPPPGLENSKMEKTLKRVPMGRPVALDDLVSAVLFLAGNSSVTGAVLPVDCGCSLARS